MKCIIEKINQISRYEDQFISRKTFLAKIRELENAL